MYLFQQFLHEFTSRRADQYGGPLENRARLLFEALEAVLEVWPSNRVGVKAVPMMSERGAFRATDKTLRTSEYVYRKMAGYGLSHMFLMRQMADLSGTPIEHMSGDAVVHHFRRLCAGTLILNVGIDAQHAAQLIGEGAGDHVAFGRDYIANRTWPNASAVMHHSMSCGRSISTAPLPPVTPTIRRFRKVTRIRRQPMSNNAAPRSTRRASIGETGRIMRYIRGSGKPPALILCAVSAGVTRAGVPEQWI
jgi:hypothetical protein